MNTNRFDIKEWAESKTIQIADDIKAYIDCGMDYEDAIDKVFDSSIVGKSYKMRALELVGHYHHEHRFVLDCVTGKNWCVTCQQFESV